MSDIFSTPWVVPHLVIIASMCVVLAPMFRYVIWGWRAKKQDITDGMDEAALSAYFAMFSRRDRPKPGDETAAFDTMYSTWYGRRFFVLPGLILFLVSLISVVLVTFTAFDTLGHYTNPVVNLPATAVAALAGAYLWVAHDLILRARRLDMGPSDILWASLRFIIAVPMGYALGSLLNESLAPLIAFTLASFPLSELLSIMRRVTAQKLDLGPTDQEAHDDIVKLQGIDAQIVERLRNEDITTVTQLAYCDPVRVVMRSNLTFSFVTDCMNQALAWLYFEDRLAVLRPLGLRGAAEIKNFVDAYDDADPQSKCRTGHDAAVAALPKVAEALQQSPETVLIVFREIAGDPYTVFLAQAWS
jgi:hypothetical protein